MRPPVFAASDAAGWTPPPRRRRPRPAISLTPLIDVVFILLVFFMLASSFADRNALRLNIAGGQARSAALEGALLVEMTADGWRVGGVALDEAGLRARATSLLADHPDQRVVLRPAAGAPLQRTLDALDMLAALGARDVGLSPPRGL